MGFFKDVGNALKDVAGTGIKAGVQYLSGNVAGASATAVGGLKDVVGNIVKPGGAGGGSNSGVVLNRELTPAESMQIINLMKQGVSQHNALKQVLGATIPVNAQQAAPALSTTPIKPPVNATKANGGLPDWQDILASAGGGALLGIGKELAGTPNVGQAGASAVDSTLNEWFKQHWHHLIMGVAGVWALFKYVINPQNSGKGGRKR